MFEDVVVGSHEDHGCHAPDDDVDGALERLLADAEADLDAVRDWLPREWDAAAPPTGRRFGAVVSSPADQSGGAKNSRAMLSGSRKETPLP